MKLTALPPVVRGGIETACIKYGKDQTGCLKNMLRRMERLSIDVIIVDWYGLRKAQIDPALMRSRSEEKWGTSIKL
jgi:hypothetical protein